MTLENEIRKEFCPNCEAETPCTHEAELYVCDICGEDFAKYIVSRNCSVSDVSMTQGVLTNIKTGQSVENTNPDYYKQEVARLTAELTRRDEIIARLKDAGNELYLKGCRNYLPLGDADWAWRALMKELKRGDVK